MLVQACGVFSPHRQKYHSTRGVCSSHSAQAVVVDEVVAHFQTAKSKGKKVAGQPIRDLVTVNGVRVMVEDGTWGWCGVVEQARARGSRREPVSETPMRDMFKAVDAVLRTHKDVGEYSRTI
jgi:phosphomannomutase/phosphoglucomutase